MKQIYLFLATFLCCSIGITAQSPYVLKVLGYQPTPAQLLKATTSTAQNSYLIPAKKFDSEDLFPDRSKFSCFDISDTLVYANDGDTIRCLNMKNGQEIKKYGKPSGYSSWPSFLTLSPDKKNIWAGYTNSGNLDDRIYKIDVTSGVWKLMAHLSGNFDLEFWGDSILVSGLNSSNWNDPTSIFVLDTTGNDSHRKIIEMGGSSAGLAVDKHKNIYYGTYFALSSGPVAMFRWDSLKIANIIADANDTLKIADAIKLTDMPQGAYDCDIDDADNLIFNFNSFSSEKVLAVWNGTSGDGLNFDTIAVAKGMSDWLTIIKSQGDIFNVDPGNTVFVGGFGHPITKVFSYIPPIVLNPIENVTVSKNLQEYTVSLTNVFTDPDNDDSKITKTVKSNSNESLVGTTINSNTLTLSFTSGNTGSAEIVIEANSAGETVTDTFSIDVRDVDFTNGVFIVNEDWFGHAKGSVNYLTNDNRFVYNTFKSENRGSDLGVTTQFGTIYGDKFYFMSKQAPRLVITDASTLKQEASFDEINAGVAMTDGRAFVGITPQKGYISTYRGIYVYNIDTKTIGNRVADTYGEVGNMLHAGKYVFALKQDTVYIINDATDNIHSSITGDSYAGIARSTDGMVWVGAGTKLVKINPYNLTNETINLPSGVTISSSSFAWNANSLCASAVENTLYWGESGGWSGSKKIYKYVIGDITSLNSPFITMDNEMELYGAGIRVHPETDRIYITGKKSGWGANSLTNILYVYDSDNAAKLSEHKLTPYYWFPAMPVFPDRYLPEINISDIGLSDNNKSDTIKVIDIVSDRDNNDAAIILKITNNSNPAVVDTKIENDTLIVSSISGSYGSADIELTAFSNGRSVTANFNVSVSVSTAITNPRTSLLKIYPNPSNGLFRVETGIEGELQLSVFTLGGVKVYSNNHYSSSQSADISQLPSGSYIVKIRQNEVVSTNIIFKK